MEANWSQSRVLPSAKLAYETGLSAGSIAKVIDVYTLHSALLTLNCLEPPPGVAPS
jgi:hypothetical protein